jgi:H+-transporting ATPase
MTTDKQTKPRKARHTNTDKKKHAEAEPVADQDGQAAKQTTAKKTAAKQTGAEQAAAKESAGTPSVSDELKSLPMAEVEKRLGSSPDGLTQAEATKRLAQYGPNEIPEKTTSPLRKLLTYFWGPIAWMIEVAVVLSGVLRHWSDFVIILVLLIANAAVGFSEERSAGKAIDALKAQLAINARVQRDGKWTNPPARELVPGDVIRMRLGDIVPADARLLDGDPVEIDESALTGESLPATRGPGDAVFSGSILRQGEIGALVYGTGADTYFGKTAELVQDTGATSHFQKAVLKIGKYLILLALVMVAVIAVVSTLRGEKILTTLQFVLVLTVAAIPVAMPTVLSVTMAVGARLLAKKQAIVSRLVAIEELAGVDVLCSDKTGTLTQNKLTLGDPYAAGDVPVDQVLLCGALASRADDNDTIDLAVLAGLSDDKALDAYTVTHFQPFDPVGKRTEATVKSADGKSFKVTKGAPQVILALAGDVRAVTAGVDQAVGEFAKRGFRSLGVARADGDGPWAFQGVLPLFDPPRDDAKATIATAEAMGVKIKMVTGDAIAIAQETAKTHRHRSEGDRGRRRLRPSVPRAQIPHRRRPPETRAHRRHDRRWRQRRPRPQTRRLRHRRLRGHRRGQRRRVDRADDSRPIGDHRRHQGEPEDFPADEQLRHLPHRRDAARAGVRYPGHTHLQPVSRHRHHDRHAGTSQRRRDHVHCLRQRPL